MAVTPQEVSRAEEITEKVPVVEVGVEPEVVGAEGEIEKIETNIQLQKPVTDDQGQVLITSPAAQKPKIVLPIREESYLHPKNWHRPVTFALRWLLEWTKRVIKMNPGATTFR